MANEVQWIKIKVGIFDGESFKKIKRAKIGGVNFRDKLTAVWFELLDFAGKCNNNGYFISNNEVPFTSIEDISIMIDREIEEVELCMSFFIKEKMIEIIDNLYCLSNWSKYQSIEGLEKIREKKRIAQAKWREKQKELPEIKEFVDDTVDTTNVLPSCSLSHFESKEDINNIPLQVKEETTKTEVVTIPISNLLQTIKKIYDTTELDYNSKFHKTATAKKLKTILNGKVKEKRLYPLQILYAYKLYISEQVEKETENTFIKGSEVFLSESVYDYAEQCNDGFQGEMVKKYGDNWQKVKFEYVD